MVIISIHAPNAGSDISVNSSSAVSHYFNPRSQCRERRVAMSSSATANSAISIHAPNAGSDSARQPISAIAMQISIHAPNAGSDYADQSDSAIDRIFQSTLPMQGATDARWHALLNDDNFNPRSQCRERPTASMTNMTIRRISIHAPNAGSDHLTLMLRTLMYLFQSTLPMQGATGMSTMQSAQWMNFNPRSQCRERLRSLRHAGTSYFNPRSQCRERR